MLTTICGRCGRVIKQGGRCPCELERQREYDRDNRNRESAAFYHSKSWSHLQKAVAARAGYQDEYVKFYLIVNGKEYEIVPANSGKSGIRLIKYSEVSNPATKVDGVELIEETIKDARIRISIKGYNDLETPLYC